MARPSKEPPSPSSLVPAIVRYARARGVDVDALALRLALPADVEDRDDAPVAPSAAGELLEVVARACGEPDLPLRLAADFPVRRYGFADLAVRASATVRDALARIARYAPLTHGGLEGALEGDAAEGRFVLRTPRRPRGLGRMLHELALGRALAQCRAEVDRPLAATRVWFAHARPPDIAPLRAFFGAGALDFGCEHSGFALDARLLGLTMRAADARMLATAEPLAEAALRARPTDGAALSARVTAHIEAALPVSGGAPCDVEAVAGAMHMSARTLQRRLEQEGTRFTELLDGVRLELARRWLADADAPLFDVAMRLGFADLATFSRAFKRWTGMPPGQWRRS
jgi:AraC-like DNA-binding protein